eukprot:4550125-Pyramimonas_sp.AAC.1
MRDAVENESYRKLFFFHLRQQKDGPKLAEVMLNVATGAARPRDRKHKYLARYAGNTMCDRCQAPCETALRRGWQCEMNQ